jgi:hypothetical protein
MTHDIKAKSINGDGTGVFQLFGVSPVGEGILQDFELLD